MRTKIKIKDKIQIWGWRQGLKISAKIHDLNYFFWETSLGCNLNCRHCGSECGMDKKGEELSAEKVLKVFKNISENYDAHKIMVAVTGGEPLLRTDLFDIMDEVSAMGFPWGMVTNGMLVDEAIVEKSIKAGMRTVSVSLDGLEASHNYLRNNEKAFKGAINALKLFNDSESFDCVEAITCVYNKNLDELEEIYEMLKGTGIKAWRVFNIFSKGRAALDDSLLLDKKGLIKVLEFIKGKREAPSSLEVSYAEEGYLGCDYERKVRDTFFYCGAGINVAGLLSDGSYSACPSLSSEWKQGHVDETAFSEVWENKYKNMRDRSWMKTKECITCKEWKNCKGSSLHLWDWKDNNTTLCPYKLFNT
ncbi:MAG TPA: radical SAM protein [Clostridiaceae bacterium]